MPTLDDLWDYDDPAASEARFRTAVEAAVVAADIAAADAARPVRWPPGPLRRR
jgi:hypothetical protein